MTLHVPRDADTLAGVVAKIVEAIGIGAAALTVGRTESTVRAWMDPSRNAEPGIEAALALDAAYFHATGLEPPIWGIYQERIGVLTDCAHGKPRYDLWRELASMHIDTARVPEAIREALHPDGPGGAAITPIEMATISQTVDRAKDAVERVEQAARAASAGRERRSPGGAS